MTAIPEIPHGAIENGRAFLQRLADHYNFTCEAGSLSNCTDYHEAVRCFEFIAQWASELTAALPFLQGVKVDAQGIYDYVQSYEWRGDNGDYTPNDADREMLEDAIVGYLSAIEPAPSPRAQAMEEAEHAVGATVLKHNSSDYEGLDSLEAYEAGQLNGLERAQASLRALSSPIADGWLPIETAPKDSDTVILVLLPRMMNLIVRARYNSVHGYWITDCDNDGRISKPTFFHPGDMWHPMPALPASPGASE